MPDPVPVEFLFLLSDVECQARPIIRGGRRSSARRASGYRSIILTEGASSRRTMLRIPS